MIWGSDECAGADVIVVTCIIEDLLKDTVCICRILESETGMSPVPGVYRQGIYSFGGDKLVLCLIEKVASRVVLELGARLDGAGAWHTNQLGEMQAYAKTKKAVSSAQLTNGIIPKIAMVRDPATRLLSGYISKIETKGWVSASSYTPNSPNETTSFEQFIGVLEGNPDMMKVNRHFRPQHLFCGFKHNVKYDCVIKYEDRTNGWKSCLIKLGMWDEFGASGWGPNNTEAIFDVQENYLNIGTPKVVTVTVFPSLLQKYYTPELLQRVYNLFKQDYEVFEYKLPLLEQRTSDVIRS